MATLLNADWLSSREIRIKVEIFQLERICRCTNPRERARLCTAKVWHDKSKLDAGFLSRKIRPIRVSTFTCMGSCRPVAFGVNAKKWAIWLAECRYYWMVRIWGDLEVGIRNDDWKISGYTPYTRVYPGLHQCARSRDHTIILNLMYSPSTPKTTAIKCQALSFLTLSL